MGTKEKKRRAKKGVADIDQTYDVIVIGGGIGGLACANMLARSKRKVLLLEQHIKLGGLATWFKRKKHIFDVALHGFPIGMIKTARKYLSARIAENIVQLEDIRFDNPQFKISTTYDRVDFTRILESRFKIERAKLDQFFDRARSMNYYDDDGSSIRDLLDRFFPGRSDVWRLLMEPITYANGSTLDDPAIAYGIVFSNFMGAGVYTFRGGTDLFIEYMEDELIEAGVEIRVAATVEKIERDSDGRISGVIANGRGISSRAVASNANLKTTALNMLDRTRLSPEFLARADAIRVNTSSAQVYIGLKAGARVDNIGELIFKSGAPEYDPEEMLKIDTSSRAYSVYTSKLRPGHDRISIVSSSNARYSDWVGMSKERYNEAKQALAEATIDDLKEYIPDIERMTDWVEAATPKTFERYTLHQEGSSFGTKFEGLEVSKSISEEAPGLFHAGSVGIIMSGWLGAANYGVIVANDIDRYLG